MTESVEQIISIQISCVVVKITRVIEFSIASLPQTPVTALSSRREIGVHVGHSFPALARRDFSVAKTPPACKVSLIKPRPKCPITPGCMPHPNAAERFLAKATLIEELIV